VLIRLDEAGEFVDTRTGAEGTIPSGTYALTSRGFFAIEA
jgi:hypothetical protein